MNSKIKTNEDIKNLLNKVYARIISPEDAYELLSEHLNDNTEYDYNDLELFLHNGHA